MNFALEVFGVREAYVIPYQVPANDVLSDNGSFELFPPAAPVVVSVLVGVLNFQSVEHATGYKLLKRVGTTYTTLATITDPDATQFLDAGIAPAAFFRVIAFNEIGDSPPSNTLFLGHPEEPPLILPVIIDPAPVVDEVFSLDFNVDLEGDLEWSISSGALPTGLTLDPETGVLSGTPTVAGSYEFTIRVDYMDGVTPAYIEQFYVTEIAGVFPSLTWGAPDVDVTGDGTGDASGSGFTFAAEAAKGAGAGNSAISTITGTGTYTGPAYTGCVNLAFVMGHATPECKPSFSVTVKQDGVTVREFTLDDGFPEVFELIAGTDTAIEVIVTAQTNVCGDTANDVTLTGSIGAC